MANPTGQNSLLADEHGNGLVSSQQSLVGASDGDTITTTYTSGTAPTAGTTQTIANAATPTVVELLQYCANLEGVVNSLQAALIAHGLLADA